jgi:hypothetical protein
VTKAGGPCVQLTAVRTEVTCIGCLKVALIIVDNLMPSAIL